MHFGLLKAWEKRLLFLLDNMALVLGASKGRRSMPKLNHTCREICVISLATFTVPVSADGSRLKVTPPLSHLDPISTARARLPILTNVGQLPRGQPLTRSCLPSSQPNPHELPMKKSKLGKSLLRWCHQPKSRKDGSRFACDAKKEGQHPPLRRDGGGDAGTHVFSRVQSQSGDCLMAGIKFVGWIQNFSDFHRRVRALKLYRR